MVLINPINEASVANKTPAPRLRGLEGKRLLLLDIGKPGGSVFLDRLESVLLDRHGVGEILREKKPTFAKPAPAAVLERMLAWKPDAFIEALAD